MDESTEKSAKPLICGEGEEGQLVLARTDSPLDADFVPDAFAPEGIKPLAPEALPIDLVDAQRLREALFGSEPVPITPRVPTAVCLSTDPTTRSWKAESGRIHRVAGLRALDSADGALLVVLHTDEPPANLLLQEDPPRWMVSLVDRDYRVVASTIFVVESPFERTWDTLETHLEARPHALGVMIRYGYDCDGHKHDQFFSITIDYDLDPPCVQLRSIEHKGFA